MALAHPVLDDLTWEQAVEGARGRIPAESAGLWTLHAPVDPGITLVELLAWLLDQRLYWLDQVANDTVRGLLGLLGEAARPAGVATTVMEARDDVSRSIPAGTVLRCAGRPELAFTARADLGLVGSRSPAGGPGEIRVGLEVDGTGRTEDLDGGRSPRLLRAGPAPSEARIAVRLPSPLDGRHLAPLGLLLELEADPGPPAEWEAAAADAPPAAEVVWSYRSRAAGRVPVERRGVADGTLGLRRSGVVRLDILDDWAPDAPRPGPDGLWSYSLWLAAEEPRFTTSPRVRAIRPNAVVAEHRVRVDPPAQDLEALVEGWLPLPGISLDAGVAGSLIDEPGATRLQLRERAGWRRWRAVASLAQHGPEERVFVVDRREGLLRFGDGLTGRLPVLARQPGPPAPPDPRVRLSVAVGGGPEGNLGAGIAFEEDAPSGFTATTAVAATGGREPETLEEACGRVRVALGSAERAVTRDDHERLACTTPGVAVARAHPAIGRDPRFPCQLTPGAATVFVVPAVSPRARAEGEARPPVPDAGLLRAVQSRMEAARLLGAGIDVEPPRYRRVSLRVAVEATPADPSALARRIESALRRFLDPVVGGVGGGGWPFGEPVRPSALVRVAQSAAGPGVPVVGVGVALDAGDEYEDCADVEIGRHHLVDLGAVRVDAAGAGSTP